MPPVLRLGLLAATVLLTGCPGDGDPLPQQLQSVTVADAQGTVLSITRYDYDSEGLARVHAYSEPGTDGIVGTADDPLYGGGYARCSLAHAYGEALHDPLAEQTGDNRIVRLFRPQTVCGLPDRSATRVTSTFMTSPGLDGQWFTPDDEGLRQLTLSRTASGSQLQEGWLPGPACGAACVPTNTSVNLNATGLNNIVYNPYAGLGGTPLPPMPIHYTVDAGGRVTTLQSDRFTHRTEYADDNFVTMREMMQPLATTGDSNIVLALYVNPGRYREEFTRLDADRTAVTSYALIEKSAYDVVGSSPTGQILLAIMGWEAAGEVTIDGVLHVKVGLVRYLVDRSAADVQIVSRLNGTGADGEWFSADDSVLQTATLRYADAVLPARVRGRAEASR